MQDNAANYRGITLSSAKLYLESCGSRRFPGTPRLAPGRAPSPSPPAGEEPHRQGHGGRDPQGGPRGEEEEDEPEEDRCRERGPCRRGGLPPIAAEGGDPLAGRADPMALRRIRPAPVGKLEQGKEPPADPPFRGRDLPGREAGPLDAGQRPAEALVEH